MTSNGKVQRIKRKLPCELTEFEKARMAEKIAKLRVEIEPYKEKRKQINEEIKVRNDSILTMSRAVEAGEEEREVVCIVEVDWDGKSKCLRRDDTGEVVQGSKQALNADELQGGLFDTKSWLSDEDDRIDKAAKAAEKMREKQAAEAAEKKGGKKAGKSGKKGSHLKPVK